MRLFLAIELPDQVKTEAIRFKRELASGLRGIKWVEDDNLHLTVKFLGEVEDKACDRIAAAVARAAERTDEFSLSTGGLEFFPGRGKPPRVVWLRMNDQQQGFTRLTRAVDEELAPLGFEPERGSAIHLTLGRIKDSGGTERLLLNAQAVKPVRNQDFSVREMVLFQSFLRSEGPRYIPLAKFGFNS